MKTTALQMKKRKSETVFHVMLLPAVVFCLIFSYVPLGGLVIAFQKFKPAKGLFGPQDWIGMGNFRYLLEMPNTVNVLRNTLVISLWKMLLGILVPLAVALLINEVANTRFKRSVQTIIFMPYFLSWIILSGIFIQMLSPADGLANQFIGLFGAEPIFFLGDNRWFQGTVIATDVWKTFGFNTIVFFAAITSIDPCLYESAKIDGAGKTRQCLNITIPCIMGTIVLLGVLSMGNILNAGFDQIFNMYSPIVYETGDILDTFVYRLGIREAQYGVAAAVGFFKSIISTLFISASYFMAYKFADYRIF